jgi:hypothetical protein
MIIRIDFIENIIKVNVSHYITYTFIDVLYRFVEYVVRTVIRYNN